MSQKEICDLPVSNLAGDDSILYLWATAPKLPEALEVMKAWGFKYVTQAVWDKKKMGTGYWFRGQHEIILVGRRGKFSPPPPTKRKSSVFEFPRGAHSEKPAEIRDLIQYWFPEASLIELFAREKNPGWDVWGNEVECSINLEDYE